MARPNPERELERLTRSLKGGSWPPVLGVVGASEFFRREAFDAVLAAVDEGAELRRIDGTQDSDGRELDDLRGASLFGTGCWIAVRRAGPWLKAHGAALQDAVEKRAPGCGLLFEAEKLDRRTKLAKSLGELGEIYEFRDLYTEPYDRSRSPLDAEIVSWLQTRARKLDLQLTPEAAFTVVSVVGQDPSELCAELDRLVVVLPKRKRLDPEALRAHLHTSFESTPFEFAEAVLARDRRRAQRSLRAMFARGVRSRDGSTMDSGGVFPFVTSWMHQALSTLYEGRRLLETGTPERDVPGRLGVRTFVDRFQAQLRQNDSNWARRALGALHHAQRELRRTGEDPELLLERFVAAALVGSKERDARRGGRGR